MRFEKKAFRRSLNPQIPAHPPNFPGKFFLLLIRPQMFYDTVGKNNVELLVMILQTMSLLTELGIFVERKTENIPRLRRSVARAEAESPGHRAG
jgi:hypothetical protein